MKRRLMRAYDHMTMPDACAHRIEQRLQQELEEKKAGRYTKAISPTVPRRNGWVTAVAAVCLMLVLSVGGTMLVLNTSQRLRTAPPETESTVLPEDRYAVATDIPAAQVETFAKVVQQFVAMENWDALADKVSFPLTIQDQRISDKKTFVEWMEIFQLNPSFRDTVAAESCTAMFCNWQGICMGNGLIWFNEVDGELKITAINVETQEEPEDKLQGKQVPDVFAEIISGDRIKMVGVMNKLTIEEYCANWQGDVKLDAFAVVDMDGDNVCELVFSLTDEQGELCGSVVLRQEGNETCGYRFRSGELLDLKKDGTFFRGDREHHLVFNDKTSCYTEEVKVQGETPPAQWHTYPCQRPDLVLKSYEYVTGTGQSLLPGTPYYTFEGLVQGTAGNDWGLQKEQLDRWGMICVEDEGTVTVFDPDAPGTALYGTLTNENGMVQFSELGYYICTEEKEYVAEVRNMLSGDPEYWVETHLPLLGSMGRRVYATVKMLDYLNGRELDDIRASEVSLEQERIRMLMNDFIKSYSANDAEGMKAYLAEGASGFEMNTMDVNLAIISYDNLPSQIINVGDCWEIDLFLREWEDPANIHHLCVELVKQEGGWKILSYCLEK